MPDQVFRDRRAAGREVADRLEHFRGRDDVVVLALPRGGLPVGYEVAAALNLPLDVFVVRKLGVPRHEELAMGAIASGGIVVLNDEVVRGMRTPRDVIERVAHREVGELERRERAYRAGRPALELAGKTVILVDDGLATGSSMRAAIVAVRRLKASRIVVAVPVAPESTREALAAEVDEVVCVSTSSAFVAVGQHYQDFTQTTDAEVKELLHAAVRGGLG